MDQPRQLTGFTIRADGTDRLTRLFASCIVALVASRGSGRRKTELTARRAERQRLTEMVRGRLLQEKPQVVIELIRALY